MTNSDQVPRSRLRNMAPLLAVLAAVVFSSVVFLPLLGLGGKLTGHMFLGDTGDFWIPQFNLLNFFVSHQVLEGIDYFTHNGSAEWFLRANLTAYFPPYLLATVVHSESNPQYIAPVIVIIEFVCAMVSVAYTYMVASRYLKFTAAFCIFIAIGYTFSWYYFVQISYVPFCFIAWIAPAVIFYSLSSARKLTLLNVSAGSFAAFSLLTAGYLPMAFQALAISGLAVIVLLLNDRESWPKTRELLFACLRAALPVVIAVVIAGPWIMAITQYAKGTIEPSFSNNINYSALDLSETPPSLPRIISGNLTVPGQAVEFSPNIGIVYLAIFVLFVGISRHSMLNVLSFKERRLMLISVALYLIFLLVTYGSATALTAVFFYFVPIAGFSHIYQRYLPLANLFLIISVAYMLKAVLLHEQSRLERVLFGSAVAIALLLAVGVGLGLNGGVIGYSPDLVFEFVYLALFLGAVIFVRGNAAIWVALLAVFLIALDRGYLPTTEPGLSFAARQSVFLPLVEPSAKGLDGQLETYSSGKEIVKVVDITPGVHGYIPENYPWFRVSTSLLSWYSGYEWHVGVPLSYRARNIMTLGADGELRFKPDPNWVAATGADVLLYDPNDKEIAPKLMALIDPSRPTLPIAYPGGTYIMAPLKQTYLGEATTSDNGFFRLTGAPATISKFESNYAGTFKFQVSSTGDAALKYDFWPNDHLQYVVNGKIVEPVLDANGIVTVPIVAGDSTVEIRYRNALLETFIALYAIFVVVLALIWGFLLIRPLWLLVRRRTTPDTPTLT